MFSNFHGVNSLTVAGFKLLGNWEEMGTLSSPGCWWGLPSPNVCQLPAQDPSSEKTKERMGVVIDGQERLPDFFLKSRLSCGKVIQAVYCTRVCSSHGSLVAHNTDKVSALLEFSFLAGQGQTRLKGKGHPEKFELFWSGRWRVSISQSPRGEMGRWLPHLSGTFLGEKP